MASEEKKYLTEFIPVKDLAVWSDKGNLSVSIKNGYPRFTYFYRDKTLGNIGAPMNMKTFIVVAGLIETVAKVKEDKTFELLCYNNDPKTKEKILQGILVIARRSDDLYIGLKKTRDVKASLVKLELDKQWHELIEDGSDSTKNFDENKNAALAYAAHMRYIANKFTNKDEGNEVPNSKREPVKSTQADDDGL